MSGNEFANRFQIPSPCTEDWDSMIGNDQIRFCSHCQKSVHDFSSMSTKQIKKLVAQSGGRLCIRYRPIVPKPIITPAQTLYKIGRRTSRIAASAFSASLGLSSAMAATVISKPSINPSPSAVVSATVGTQTLVDDDSGSLEGVIFDPKGAAIPGARVTIVNAGSKESLTSYADGNGHYEFKDLKAGIYNLNVEATGFAVSDLPRIPVRGHDKNRIDQTLSIAAVTETVEIQGVSFTSGAVAILPEDSLVRAALDDDLEAVKDALLRTDANTRDKLTEASALEHAVRNGNREMIQLLLWAKANVNTRNAHGQTVLMMLGENATSDLVWDLLNAGAKVNARDEDGDTPLSEAAAVNNTEILKTLLDAGAKVNTATNEGETPLMRAADEDLVNNIRLLIQAGADINARDKEGRTALIYAKDSDNRAAVRLLISLGASEFNELAKK